MTDATGHLRHGDLVEAIAETETSADILLMGKRGEGADFARGHLGSNLERVMRACHKPLCVVSRALRPITRVLIAFDGSASALRAVDHVSRNTLYSGLEIGADTGRTRAWLSDAGAMLAAAGHSAETTVMPGQPETVLPGLVEAKPFDLMVMGASGHSHLRSLFVGSTTLEMIRSCKIPVMLVR